MNTFTARLDRKRREVPWLLYTSIFLFWAAFLFNAWTWGALGRVPVAGSMIETDARRSGVLALSYMKAGHAIADLLGKPELGVEGVKADFTQALLQVPLEPTMAIRDILASKESWRGSMLRWSHYATLPLFALWVLFTVFRTRTRQTFGRKP